MHPIRLPRLAIALAVAALLIPASAPDVLAFGDSPAPRVDCSKKANKSKPACKRSRSEQHDDEVYHAAYLLSRAERYAEAQAVLAQAHNPSDPRILNYMGYTTRKLGDVDGALVYYARALSLAPNYTVARSYMGEAFLQKGDLARARTELAEIAARCGTTCQEHAELAQHIARFERESRKPG